MARKNDNKYVYGICQNRDYKDTGKPCPKCSTREVQKLRADEDFVCAECKEELRKVPAPPPPRNWKLIIGIIASIAVISGVFAICWYFFPDFFIFGDKSRGTTIELAGSDNETDKTAENEDDDDAPATQPTQEQGKKTQDTSGEPSSEGSEGIVPPPGTMPVSTPDTTKSEPKDTIKKEPAKAGGAKAGSSATPTSYSLGWGRYEGPMNGGKPHGTGGEVTVTRSYSLDLKKSPAEHVELNRGDKIVNTKFVNGSLRQGEIHFANGTRRWINL